MIHHSSQNNRQAHNMPLLYVVLVSWNSRDDVLHCLNALQQQSYPAFQITLVDNHSTDGTVQAVQAAFPTVHLFALDQNYGFAHAANVGLDYGLAQGGDYFLLLNSDTYFDADLLSQLIATMVASQHLGIASPKIYLRCDPNLLWGIGGSINTGGLRFYGLHKHDTGQYDTQLLDFVFGCAMIIRAEVLRQIGFLDERFFVFFEEIDLCLRARMVNWEVALIPHVHVWHTGGGSTTHQHYLRQFYLSRSRIIFLRKYRAFFKWNALILREARSTAQIIQDCMRQRRAGILIGHIHGTWAGLLKHGTSA